jgi:hypothetical protein
MTVVLIHSNTLCALLYYMSVMFRTVRFGVQFRCFRFLTQAAHDTIATEPSIAGVAVSETPYTVKDRINYQDG